MGFPGVAPLCHGAIQLMGVAPVGDDEGRVPIAEFVTALRAELKTAHGKQGSGLQFAVGPVTVEFTVVTGREGGPEGKVRFWGLRPAHRRSGPSRRPRRWP